MYGEYNTTIDNTSELLGIHGDDLLLIRWKTEAIFNFKIINYVIGISGILLNLVTLSALFKRKGPLKFRLKLLASLTVSDLIIALLSTLYFDFCWTPYEHCSLIHSIMPINDKSGVGIIKCVLNDVYSVAQYAGLSSMFAISLDLLNAVRRPFHYHQWSMNSGGYINVYLMWAIPFGMQLFVSGTAVYPTLGKRRDHHDYSRTFILNWLYYVISTTSVISFIIIYCFIIYKLRQQCTIASSAKVRNLKRVVYTATLIIGTYMLCLMPVVWYYLLAVMFPIKSKPMFVSVHVLRLLYVSNTIWDPIIFSVRVPEIRNEIINLWKLLPVSNCDWESRRRNMEGTVVRDRAVTPM